MFEILYVVEGQDDYKVAESLRISDGNGYVRFELPSK